MGVRTVAVNGAEEAQRWLATAEAELEFARYAADGNHFAQACFAAQQTAEKAVMAAHFVAGARVVAGHSVRGLIERLDPAVPRLRMVLEDARALDLYYVPTRYPNGLTEGTPAEAFSAEQADHAIECAARVVAAAKDHLQGEGADPSGAGARTEAP